MKTKEYIKKKLILVSGRANPLLTKAIVKNLDINLTPISIYDFANGEIYARFEESVRGADAFVIQSHPAPTNKWLMEQLIIVDALKRASAKRITVVTPFYPYSRQDKKHKGREPISARLIADLFKVAGANRLMSVDLHTSQIQGFFEGPVDHLTAIPILANYIKEKINQCKLITVVSPDTGRVRSAEIWADMFGGSPLAFVHKSRDLNVPNQVISKQIVGNIKNRICIIIDDMIDTGLTICGAVKVLKQQGAKKVIIAATHGIFSYPAYKKLKKCGAEEIVITDTLPINKDKNFKNLKIISIAPLIANAIKEVFNDGSVTSLFKGM